jgi:hypothetical protein
MLATAAGGAEEGMSWARGAVGEVRFPLAGE